MIFHRDFSKPEARKLADVPFIVLGVLYDMRETAERTDAQRWVLSLINNPFYRWLVLDTETKDLVTVHTDGNEQLSVMRFSPGKGPDSLSESSSLFISSLGSFQISNTDINE